MSGDETKGNLGKGKTKESSKNDTSMIHGTDSSGNSIVTVPGCAFRTIPSTANGKGHRKESPLSASAPSKGAAMEDSCTPQLKSKETGVQRVPDTKGLPLATSAPHSTQSASPKNGPRKPPPVTPKARETASASNSASRSARTRPHSAVSGTPSAGTRSGVAAVGPKKSKANSTPLSAVASGPKQAGRAATSGPKQAGRAATSGPKQAGRAATSGPKQAGRAATSGPKQAGRAATSGPKQAGRAATSRAVIISGPKPGDQNASTRKQGSGGAGKIPVNSRKTPANSGKTPVNSRSPQKKSANATPSGPVKVQATKKGKKSPKATNAARRDGPAGGTGVARGDGPTGDAGVTTSTQAGPSAKRSAKRRGRGRRKKTNGLKDKQEQVCVGMTVDHHQRLAGGTAVVDGAGVGACVYTKPSGQDNEELAELCHQMQEACVITTSSHEVVLDPQLAHVYRQLVEVEEHPDLVEGLSVVGPEDSGEVQVGTEILVTFTVINDSDIDRELQSYGPVPPNPSIVGRTCCPCLITRNTSSTEVIVSMTGSSSQILHGYICFNFDGSTKLYHKVHLTVTSAIVRSLVPDGVYEQRRPHPVDYKDRLDNALDGVKPVCPPPQIIMDTNSKYFHVPEDLRASPKRFCLPYLEQPLTLEMYSTKFDVLLWLEELGEERNVRQYDMSSVSLFAEDDYLCLKVPGLAKRKQPVKVGDKLIFSTYNEEPADDASSDNPVQKQKAKKKKPLPFNRDGEHYSAYVHKISLREEVLKVQFMPWFHESADLCGKKYEVMFTINRVPLMRMHDALDMAEDIGDEVLFPTTEPSPPPPSLDCACQNLQFINTTLNLQQKRAVEAIVSAACRPIPYILFGPPGTGKTVTVVESILQVYKRDISCKIVACAPSNSAADLLAERLHNSERIDKGSMVRLNAASRSKELLSSIQEYNMAANDARAVATVLRSRIIVCTCSTAAVLVRLEMTFNYVFVDEAGQAVEPECLIPVTLLAKGCGQLVLAGDPLQLGPVVISTLASDNGLSKSMLERMMERDLYRRDTTLFAATGNYDSMVVTKLVENYRSHEALLKLYSEQFYDGELVERASRGMTHSLCNWQHLPTKGIPLLFHGVQGAEKRDRGSPSWFNAFEAEQVLDYAKKLVLQRSVLQSDVGIIAPYNKQVEKIRQLLDSEGLTNVKVGSVEEFQGRENLVIIISTVRSTSTFLLEDIRKQLGFVSSPKRFNVAISRAKALLIVVGNPHLLAQDPCWSKLIQYARDNHCYTGCPLL